MPRREGDQDTANADLPRDGGCVQRARTAIDDHGEGTCIETTLGRHGLHGVGHRGNGDAQDAVRHLCFVEAEWSSDVAHGAERRFLVERHRAAEEVLLVKATQEKVGVGDRGLGPATSVGCRSGDRSSALRANAQGIAFADAGNRAAARADLEDIDHRDLDGQGLLIAADQRAAGGERLALADHARLGGRATHVESDRLAETHLRADRLCADDACGRT